MKNTFLKILIFTFLVFELVSCGVEPQKKSTDNSLSFNTEDNVTENHSNSELSYKFTFQKKEYTIPCSINEMGVTIENNILTPVTKSYVNGTFCYKDRRLGNLILKDDDIQYDSDNIYGIIFNPMSSSDRDKFSYMGIKLDSTRDDVHNILGDEDEAYTNNSSEFYYYDIDNKDCFVKFEYVDNRVNSIYIINMSNERNNEDE